MGLIGLCALLVCVVFLSRIIQELRKPLDAERETDASRQIEDLWPLHAQHFPQFRQTLIAIQQRDGGLKATHQAEQEWQEQRRNVLAVFLRGLAEDFARLGQIVKILKNVAPLTAVQQRDMTSCQTQFRINYRIASVLIAGRWLDPTKRLSRLTEILANISALVETNMSRGSA